MGLRSAFDLFDDVHAGFLPSFCEPVLGELTFLASARHPHRGCHRSAAAPRDRRELLPSRLALSDDDARAGNPLALAFVAMQPNAAAIWFRPS